VLWQALEDIQARKRTILTTHKAPIISIVAKSQVSVVVDYVVVVVCGHRIASLSSSTLPEIFFLFQQGAPRSVQTLLHMIVTNLILESKKQNLIRV